MYNNFVVQLEGLEMGRNEFSFLLDDAFFETLPYSIIPSGNMNVSLIIDKKERLFEMSFDYKGSVVGECDLCGDELDVDLDFDCETILKFGEEADEDEGILIVERGTNEYDFSHHLYENLCIMLPSRIVHENEKDCNQEQLALLRAHMIDSNDKETDKAIDPRWEALNKLK